MLETTADALIPGTVKEGARAIWQLDQLRVTDGGADFDADTPGRQQAVLRARASSSLSRY